MSTKAVTATEGFDNDIGHGSKKRYVLRFFFLPFFPIPNLICFRFLAFSVLKKREDNRNRIWMRV
jgi:hypothetical protein